jgi:hypothetical protein
VPESRLVDIVVTHAEVVGDLMQNGVVHLGDQLLARGAPTLDVMLQQDDPFGISAWAEGRLRTALKVSKHAHVDSPSTIVLGRIGLNRDHEVVGLHAGAQVRGDAVQGVGGDRLEVVRGNVIRHTMRIAHGADGRAAS